tara:strand:- start:11263 stop:11397 length:135 start_codon:yes stop_codon:yes gene_type:complete
MFSKTAELNDRLLTFQTSKRFLKLRLQLQAPPSFSQPPIDKSFL